MNIDVIMSVGSTVFSIGLLLSIHQIQVTTHAANCTPSDMSKVGLYHIW